MAKYAFWPPPQYRVEEECVRNPRWIEYLRPFSFHPLFSVCKVLRCETVRLYYRPHIVKFKDALCTCSGRLEHSYMLAKVLCRVLGGFELSASSDSRGLGGRRSFTRPWSMPICAFFVALPEPSGRLVVCNSNVWSFLCFSSD